jgi:hypothetical protein
MRHFIPNTSEIPEICQEEKQLVSDTSQDSINGKGAKQCVPHKLQESGTAREVKREFLSSYRILHEQQAKQCISNILQSSLS